MISDADKITICRLAGRYRAQRVLLFGSSTSPQQEPRDIDLAVEGVAPGDFFSFYGELMALLSRPVDLVDLSEHGKFTDLIRREGVPIYG